MRSRPPSSRAYGRGLRALATALLAAALPFGALHCAESACRFNSECADTQQCIDGKCQANCLVDRDCPDTLPRCAGGRCVATKTDSGTPDGPLQDSTADSGTPDTATSPPDTATTPDTATAPPDTTTPDTTTPDTTTPGTGAYLDPCTAAGDCASGMCTATSPQFCTRACSRQSDCAHGQICSSAKACVLDDSGAACDPVSAVPCASYCYGSPSSAQCTHECTSAADCAAGFACSDVGGTKVCVNIEIPCGTADECPSGLGFCGATGLGCTATCKTAADCPARLLLTGITPYTCQVNGGKQVCVPASDVQGPDPLGATCNALGNTCRSGACDDGTSPASCAQRCVPRGGCPAGFGCFPLYDPAQTSLVCNRAGTLWLGDTCGRGSDCVTGMCQGSGATGYCTRMCADGLCPTGFVCQDSGVTADDGTRVRLCTR